MQCVHLKKNGFFEDWEDGTWGKHLLFTTNLHSDPKNTGKAGCGGTYLLPQCTYSEMGGGDSRMLGH